MPGADYFLTRGGDMECGSIVLAYNASWPSFTPYPVRPFRIRYRAGIDANLSPSLDADTATKHAIKLLVAGMYENRESEVMTDKSFMDALAQRYGVEAYIQLRQVEFPC